MKLYKCGAEALSSDCLEAERREEESLWQRVRPRALIWITVSSRVRRRTPIITLFCGWSEATWSERRRATSEPLTPKGGKLRTFSFRIFLFIYFLRGCKAFGVVAAMLQQNDVPRSVWTLLISECLRPVDGAQPRVVERAAACRPTAAARTWTQWYATGPQEHLLGRVTSGKSFCRSTVCESHCEGSASVKGAGGCWGPPSSSTRFCLIFSFSSCSGATAHYQFFRELSTSMGNALCLALCLQPSLKNVGFLASC